MQAARDELLEREQYDAAAVERVEATSVAEAARRARPASSRPRGAGRRGLWSGSRAIVLRSGGLAREGWVQSTASVEKSRQAKRDTGGLILFARSRSRAEGGEPSSIGRSCATLVPGRRCCRLSVRRRPRRSHPRAGRRRTGCHREADVRWAGFSGRRKTCPSRPAVRVA